MTAPTATPVTATLARLAPPLPVAGSSEPASYRKAAGWVIAALWIAAIVYVVVLYIAAGRAAAGSLTEEGMHHEREKRIAFVRTGFNLRKHLVNIAQ